MKVELVVVGPEGETIKKIYIDDKPCPKWFGNLILDGLSNLTGSRLRQLIDNGELKISSLYIDEDM
jgi:hypothetical protein